MRSFFAGLAILAAPSALAQEPWPGTRAPEDPYAEYRLVKAQGLCNTKASANSLNQFDAKAWRDEFRQNCWWPAFERRSRYFIKTYDWGAGAGLQVVVRGSISVPGTEIWVQGLHQEDASVSYRRSLTLYRITCARGTDRYAAVQFIAYDANDRIVEQWERPKAASRAAVPGSKEEAFASAICT